MYLLNRIFISLKGCRLKTCCQAQVQVPGQVQTVQGLRTKDLDLGYSALVAGWTIIQLIVIRSGGKMSKFVPPEIFDMS